MLLGAHESTAGGAHRAFEHCARDRVDAVQVWLKSSRQWAARELDDGAVAAFRAAHADYRTPLIPVQSHASYLINLGSADDTLWHRSTEALIDECLRAELLGVSQVVVHPGGHQGHGVAFGIARIGAALRRIAAALGDAKVRLLLELTAGQGTCVGCSFEEIAGMLDAAGERRLGVCLDTQHLWAAGYDWTTPRGYDAVMRECDRVVGLEHVLSFHLNDSKRPLGSRVDRHERIGDGQIGLEPFRRLVNDPRFANLPGLLETPPLASGKDSYQLGIRRLRSLLATPAAGSRSRAKKARAAK